MAGGRPLEVVIDRPGLLAGAVFLGRVSAVDRRLDAAFVDLGQSGRPGFLPGAAALGLSEGHAVAVRVRAEARGGKGPLLATITPDPAWGGSFRAPAQIHRPTALERLLAAHPGVSRVLVDDMAALAEARRLFPAAETAGGLEVDDIFDAALSPEVALPSGGRLLIEANAALTAIDVDSGAGRAADANREAVAAIARELRLRGIGGQMVVDFVSHGGKAALFKLARTLKTALADDPVPCHVFGVTPLGLVELTRERRGLALSEVAGERNTGPSAETAALATLRRVLAETAGRPGLRPRLAVAPEIADALARLPEALAETERRLGHPLVIRPLPGRPRQDPLIEDSRP